MDMTLDDPIVHIVSRLHEAYSHLYDITATNEWWYFTPLRLTQRADQGWKLHLSAIPTHASSMLEVVADLLIEHGVRWKVCVSIAQLIALLSVPTPLSQVGKFITVYPNSTDLAVELAELLHSRTGQFAGPIIPSDRRYAQGSQVYYRYGSFERRYFYHPDNALKTPYILAPDGKKVVDERAPARYAPNWVTNPFPGFTPSTSSARVCHGLFGKKLTVKGLLRQSAKGGVYAVSDGSRTFILKEARFGTNPDLLGRDARDRLTNEYAVLQRLSPLKIAPQPLELFEAEGNRYLLMEHLAGQSLRMYIERRNYLGDDDLDHLRLICTSVIELVRQCHSTGVILRDLSPNNVLVTRTGCLLVDLENAYCVDSPELPFRAYTPGYVPLGAEKQDRTTPAYDLYALGAVLFFILTGIDPYLSSHQDVATRVEALFHEFLRDRDRQLLDIVDLARSYLTWKSSDDEPALVSLTTRPVATGSTNADSVSRDEEESLPFDLDTLLQHATAQADHLHDTATWQSPQQLWQGGLQGEIFHPACFHTGTTGIAYYLCELAQVTGDTKYYAFASEIMDWTLEHYPFVASQTPPGLYFGYGAVPWVLAMIADGLDDAHSRVRALELAHQIAHTSIAQLDITHGVAGIGLMHLELYLHTGESDQLSYARSFANRIVEQAEEDEEGNTVWSLQGGRHIWGFAHGAAGLAYFLLANYAQGGDTRFAELAERTGQSLIRVALPTAHGHGLSWTKDASDTSTIWTHWCNGASGVGTYLLPASRLLRTDAFEDAAVRAANAVRFAHGFGTCCQCHGLAGDGDYLLQVSRALGWDDIEQDARRIARKLYALRVNKDNTGTLPGWVWPGEIDRDTPEYMVGYPGIYSFLLRLFRPDLRRPLTMDWERQV